MMLSLADWADWAGPVIAFVATLLAFWEPSDRKGVKRAKLAASIFFAILGLGLTLHQLNNEARESIVRQGAALQEIKCALAYIILPINNPKDIESVNGIDHMKVSAMRAHRVGIQLGTDQLFATRAYAAPYLSPEVRKQLQKFALLPELFKIRTNLDHALDPNRTGGFDLRAEGSMLNKETEKLYNFISQELENLKNIHKDLVSDVNLKDSPPWGEHQLSNENNSIK